MKLRVFILIGVFLARPALAADVKIPDCNGIKDWASVVVVPDNGDQTPPETADSVKTLFSNERTSQTFGKAFSEWSETDFQHVEHQVGGCQDMQKRYDPAAYDKLGYVLKKLYERPKPQETVPNLRIKKPDCGSVNSWALEGAQALKQNKHMQQVQDQMFSDVKTARLFGLGFSQWNIYEKTQGYKYIADCRIETFPRGHKMTSESDRNTFEGYQLAQSYVQHSQRNDPNPRAVTKRVYKQMQEQQK
ncbi:MAG: hypothetical protein KDI65_10190 [Alphaproteobacteria bacterium]|nr:hypothetical protein [Alphaproteobacteria bacterium]